MTLEDDAERLVRMERFRLPEPGTERTIALKRLAHDHDLDPSLVLQAAFRVLGVEPARGSSELRQREGFFGGGTEIPPPPPRDDDLTEDDVLNAGRDSA